MDAVFEAVFLDVALPTEQRAQDADRCVMSGASSTPA
jgi:hypothetical protein